MDSDRTRTENARRGVALHRAGLDEQAVEALLAAVAEAPGSVDLRRYLAASLWRSGSTRRALAVLRDALLADPTAVPAWLDLGRALLAAGDWRPARYALHEAVLLDPGCEPAARLLRGIDGLPERQAELARAAHARWVLEDPAATVEARKAALAELLTCHGPEALAELLAQEQPVAGLPERLTELGVLALGLLRRCLPPRAGLAEVVLGALGAVHPDSARDALDRLAHAAEPERRLAAAGVVAELAASVPDPYEEILRGLLADPQPELGQVLAERAPAALDASLRAGRASSFQALLEAYAEAADHPAQAALLEWLNAGAWTTAERAEEALQLCLSLGRHDVATATLSGLAAAADGEERLRRVYTSGASGLRRAALAGFALAGATDLLAMALWDDEASVRVEAADQLGRLGDPEGLGPLRERLDLESSEAAKAALLAAVEALAAVAPPAAAESEPEAAAEPAAEDEEETA